MYSVRILEERQDAHNSNVANKIIDMMDKLRLSANTNSPRRWIWELLQNAKDVCNSSGKVKVKIHLDEENRILEFIHNGKPFSTKNIVFLIEQVSTKERDSTKSGEEKTTGKFGTGFLTTHLLSEIVTVNGYLSDDDDPIRKFKVTLDRSGKNKEEIVGAIHKAFKELENSEVAEDHGNDYDIDEYNTIFRYDLNEKGIEVAKIGIEDLKISIPYVLAFTPQIEEIYIENENIKYSLKGEYHCKLANSTVYKIQEEIGATIDNHYVLLVKDQSVSVTLALENRHGNVWIKPFHKRQPKLFCDFPLVGTNDFPFPVIVNSGFFNPTEPRDGVFLTDNDNEKIEENKNLILKACALYQSLLDYASENGWLGLYNVTNIRKIPSKEWYSTEWLKENVVNKCKEHIKYCPIIDNASGKRIALYKTNGDIQVEIPNHLSEEVRNGIWELSSKLIPNTLPCKEDIHYWYYSLWSECKNFDLKKLTKKIENLEDKTNLYRELEAGVSSEKWLKEYYILVKHDNQVISDIASGEYAVVPNQNGVFKVCTEIFLDNGIDEEYKEILSLLGEECREYLLDKDVDTVDLTQYKKLGNNNIILKIKEELKWVKDELEKDIYSRILILYDVEHKEYRKQIKIIKFANRIFENYLRDVKCVKNISNELLEKSITYMATCITDRISDEENIDNFADHFCFKNKNEALEWLSEFVEYLSNFDFENLLNKSTRTILPNQKGCFVTKDDLFLDDGEIDDELKDIATEVGYDIRSELLDKAICLKLPENRERHAKDLAEPIVRFVKDNFSNRINQREDIKLIFKRIFIWIDENTELAKKILPEIYENKHWLYNDKEIALNMKKAEAYDALMEKYNIGDVEILEKLIQYNQQDKLNIIEDETSTEQLLLQLGIDSENSLKEASENNFFAENFIHLSESNFEKLKYVQGILERSRKRIFEYLKRKKEYNVENPKRISENNTIYCIEKNGEEIYLITRPSDCEKVIIYYDEEKDVLDYTMDWELWVDNGKTDPQKITFGKILKLTGINRIPLKRVR